MKEMMALSMKLLCLPFSLFVVTVVKVTGNLSYMERGTHYPFQFRKFKIRKQKTEAQDAGGIDVRIIELEVLPKSILHIVPMEF